MKKTLIAILAIAALAFTGATALAGYPLKVSASPGNGQIDAAQPVGETSSAVVSDQWNVPVEHKTDLQTGAKGGGDAGQRTYYDAMRNEADQWNVPEEFTK